MKKWLPLLLALWLSVPSCILLQREIARSYFHSQVLDATFALYDLDPIPTFLCTATIFWREHASNGYRYSLITAGHCVAGSDHFAVAKEIGERLLPVDVIRAKVGDDVDFAILELRTPNKFPALVLSDQYDGIRGDAIFCANFSDGMPEQAAEGYISSRPFEILNGRRKRIFLAHLFGSPGISGASIVSEETHEIIGVVTTGFGMNVGVGVEPMSQKEID